VTSFILRTPWTPNRFWTFGAFLEVAEQPACKAGLHDTAIPAHLKRELLFETTAMLNDFSS